MQLAGDRLQVVEIDAASQPEIAKQWGVLSVPTTFILDEDGKPRHVNHGITPTDKLLKELETFSDFSI
jgi:thioredoxin-like negative regulator of GroEL